MTEPLLYHSGPIGRPPVAIPPVRIFMMPREVKVAKGGGGATGERKEEVNITGTREACMQ